jgi:hypothetical protein
MATCLPNLASGVVKRGLDIFGANEREPFLKVTFAAPTPSSTLSSPNCAVEKRCQLRIRAARFYLEQQTKKGI